MNKRKTKFGSKRADSNRIIYLDISVQMEDGLHLIANLLDKIEPSEGIDSIQSDRIASVLKKYLNEKLALEHIFHERRIPPELKNDEEFRLGLLKLKRTFNNAI